MRKAAGGGLHTLTPSRGMMKSVETDSIHDTRARPVVAGDATLSAKFRRASADASLAKLPASINLLIDEIRALRREVGELARLVRNNGR
jgi:hypothetical protein